MGILGLFTSSPDVSNGVPVVGPEKTEAETSAPLNKDPRAVSAQEAPGATGGRGGGA